MIILQMSGGLGNQMFQYAMYLKLKKLGREVKFDDVETYKLDNARPIQLTVFDISYPRASKEEIVMMRDSSPALKDKIRRKLHGRKLKQYVEKDYSYDEAVYALDDVYLIGYFQTERYFLDMEDEIRRNFVFRKDLFTDEMRNMERCIAEVGDSVSIHVRRGDYMMPGAADVFAGVCTDEYYEAAIRFMTEKCSSPVFFLFTNDQVWADFFIEQHKDADIRAVKVSNEYTGYLDMYLMTVCRHHIVANSSFSWWGAWLSADRTGMTIAPDPWFKNDHCKDIHCRRMKLITPDGKLED